MKIIEEIKKVHRNLSEVVEGGTFADCQNQKTEEDVVNENDPPDLKNVNHI